MAPEDRQWLGLRWAATLAGILLQAAVAYPQALAVERLGNGTTLVDVAWPGSDATSVAWPEAGAAGQAAVRSMVSGRLTLVADLEAAFGQGTPSPVVVVAAGGAALPELRATLTRLLVAPPPPRPQSGARELLVEGGVERRLCPPGSEARLRLALSLPPAGDPRRSSVEVLLEIVPDILADQIPALRLRVEGDQGLLEARVDPEMADLKLATLRLALARIANEPSLATERVQAARRRLEVRRLARLELHPDGASAVAECWLRDGDAAVRELLFGFHGVSLDSVQRAASEWLPQHPGMAVFLLPPHVLSPRFAPAPELVRLDNDLTVAVLERRESPLARLCLRPVLLADVDGEVAATILTRLAADLRAGDGAPAWVRVERSPVRLELAAEPDGFAELCEALRTALERLAGEESAAAATPDDARRRALQLTAAQVGLAEGGEMSPAQLLRPANLALGAVAGDGEAALDAIRKLFADLRGGSDRPRSVVLAPGQRTREAAPGQGSLLALVVPAGSVADPIPASVLAELIRQRSGATAEVEVEVLEPLVPGRRVLVVLLRSASDLDQLERWSQRAWARWTAPVTEGDLAPVRRRVAAAAVAAASGSVGQARECAAVAAGEREWRPPTQLELEILSLDPAPLNELLRGARDWGGLASAGAGALPLTAPPQRDTP